MRKYTFALICFISVLLAGSIQAGHVTLDYDANIGQITFAVAKIKAALNQKGYVLGTDNTELTIVIQIRDSGKQAESYSIQREKDHVIVSGQDAAGAMYGGLELAEQIRLGDLGNVQNTVQTPYLSKRGIKLNVPLDMRTPSYSDPSAAFQINMPEVWSFEFWKTYFDTMAEYRYNFISLWSLHPFPSLIKLKDYPEIALDDVHRSTGKWKKDYPLVGVGFDAPDIVDSYEVVKKITIDEKIDFWKKVMAYAKSRNIKIYFITWNIFTYGTNGKYGIDNHPDNETTTDYFRKSVKQMFLTYPDLAGMGITAGENMHMSHLPKGNRGQAKADWTFKTYGQGILDAAKELPGRKLEMIHRQHQAGSLQIANNFQPLVEHPDIKFFFSFKYAKAHVMSCLRQPYHPPFVKDIRPRDELKTIWTMRNDSNYYFRWGAPDYVRQFIKNVPYDVSLGMYYGSDGYFWGRDFLNKDESFSKNLTVQNHWYHWMMWGRLSYHPELSNDRLVQVIQTRFPEIKAGKLFKAWQAASMTYPLVTGFHWGPVDFVWYPEACRSRPGPAQTESGFHDVNRFLSLPPHPESGNIGIVKYVDAIKTNKAIEGITPIQLSKEMHKQADQALSLLDTLNAKDNKELALTLDDIRCMAWLGKYYAHKIRGCTEVQLHRTTKKQSHQDAAVRELTKAAEYWKFYMTLAKTHYKNPLWTNRIGHVDWDEMYQEVLNDIEIAKESK